MVKNYVKLIVALMFATNLMAQNVPSYVPTNGLKCYWPFNGNANDESGNGNNGSVINSTLTKDRFGKNNSAYHFNGIEGNSNASTIVLNNSIFNIGQPEYSICFWFKPDNNTQITRCLFNTIPHTGIAIGYNDNNAPGYVVYDIGPGNAYWTNLYLHGPSKNYIPNQWYFVTLTKSNKDYKFYINGKLEHSYTNQSASSYDYDVQFRLSGIGSDVQTFEGDIDDFGMWNRALTQEEVTALYTSTPPCTTPSATVTPQGNTTFCQGGFVNLNASTGTDYKYEWYNNGQLINGATASVYQASTSGNYTVKVSDGACNATSTATTVTVNQYPSSGVSVSGNTTFCEGNSVTLTAQGSGTYLWSNGATSKSITVNQAGSYGVVVTSNGCVSNSNQTTVTVNPNPTATITSQGNTTFCQGGFVNLVASGGTSFQWNTGSSAASISATQSGTYTVNVFNSFGCQASASQQVIVNPLPNVTLNALNQFTLKNASPFQLVASPVGGTFSGDGVQGATFTPANVSLGKKTITYNYTSPQGCSGKASSNTFVVDSIGNVCNVTKYDTVKVTKTINDTVSILKVKFKLTTGIKANQYTTMNVYPNPTSDVIIIEASDVAALNGYSYKLVDIQGKELYNNLVTNVKTEISLKTFGNAGVYILHVVDANNISIETKQIVLE